MLYVTLGDTHYRIERPWGDVPGSGGAISDVACDDRGHVFVLLRGDPYGGGDMTAVVELGPDGKRLASWGGDVIADAHMLTITPDGRLFVVDRDPQEIVCFDRSGKRLGGIGRRHHAGRPFCHPCDIALAPSGELYVADGYGGSQVNRFTGDGELIASWGGVGNGPGQFAAPHAIWVQPSGNVAVVDRDNHRVQIFTADGRFLRECPGHATPLGLYGDAAGRLYVTDSMSRLTLLSPEGEIIGRCKAVVGTAHGVWMDAAGHIFLAEGRPSRITRLAPIDKLP